MSSQSISLNIIQFETTWNKNSCEVNSHRWCWILNYITSFVLWSGKVRHPINHHKSFNWCCHSSCHLTFMHIMCISMFTVSIYYLIVSNDSITATDCPSVCLLLFNCQRYKSRIHFKFIKYQNDVKIASISIFS